MTTDDFTTAAWEHWESQDRTSTTASMAFAEGAVWARDHIAQQEPSEAEVNEAALAMCRGDGAGTCFNYDDTVHAGCTDHTDDARAALTAAKEATR